MRQITVRTALIAKGDLHAGRHREYGLRHVRWAGRFLHERPSPPEAHPSFPSWSNFVTNNGVIDAL